MASKSTLRGGEVPPPLETHDGILPEDAESGTIDEELPDNVIEEEGTGDWIYTIQHPFEPKSTKGPELLPDKIRIRKNIYVKDVRRASFGEIEAESLFYLACSISGISPEVLNRLDSRDYGPVLSLVGRRARKNAETE